MSTSKQSKQERKQARTALRQAREALAEVSKRDRTETDAYLKANQRVADAEKRVPWWQR